MQQKAQIESIGLAVTTSWRAYLPMMKPTISLLVVVTVVPAMLMATASVPPLLTLVATLLGTFFASASSAVFNHILDSDLDMIMNRTRGRPVPSGQVSQNAAFAFGSFLAISSLVILYLGASPLAAVVAFAANAFYALIYTLCLKRYTVQNIVIGGAAGAVGPLIGWAAVSGELSWQAWMLFAIIFLWTPPHFWALALKYKKDYALARVPMLPVIKGDEMTRKQIFIYTLTLFPPVLALYVYGAAGIIYLGTAMAATTYFAVKAWQLYREHTNQRAMPLFHYSCLYVFIIFGGLTLDKLIAMF